MTRFTQALAAITLAAACSGAMAQTTTTTPTRGFNLANFLNRVVVIDLSSIKPITFFTPIGQPTTSPTTTTSCGAGSASAFASASSSGSGSSSVSVSASSSSNGSTSTSSASTTVNGVTTSSSCVFP